MRGREGGREAEREKEREKDRKKEIEKERACAFYATKYILSPGSVPYRKHADILTSSYRFTPVVTRP